MDHPKFELGTVAVFFVTRGYGFIQTDNGTNDVFFHLRQFRVFRQGVWLSSNDVPDMKMQPKVAFIRRIKEDGKHDEADVWTFLSDYKTWQKANTESVGERR